MQKISKLSFVFLAVFFLIALFSSVCVAAALKEQNLNVKKSVSEDKVITIKITVKASNGGPAVNSLPVDYPEGTILMVTASLTLKKGFYKVELLNKDKTSMTITAENGKTDKDSGEVSVDETGSIRYRVTAKKANSVVFDLSFIPVAIKKDYKPNQVSSYDKMSDSGGGLNLALTCLAGKNCTLKVQNMGKSKAYRNILFQIDYNMMDGEQTIEKIKRGAIEDTILPDQKGEWQVGLVFGEPPRNIKIKLIGADTVDPAAVTGSDKDQLPKVVILNAVSERLLKK
jgi:biopolymer transport protein ExbD